MKIFVSSILSVFILLFFVSCSESSSADENKEQEGEEFRNTTSWQGTYDAIILNSHISYVVLEVGAKGEMIVKFDYDKVDYTLEGDMYTDNFYQAKDGDFEVSGSLESNIVDDVNFQSSMVIKKTISENNFEENNVLKLRRKNCDYTVDYTEGNYSSSYARDQNEITVDIDVTLALFEKKVTIFSADMNVPIVCNVNDCGQFFGNSSSVSVEGQFYSYDVNNSTNGEAIIYFKDAGYGLGPINLD